MAGVYINGLKLVIIGVQTVAAKPTVNSCCSHASSRTSPSDTTDSPSTLKLSLATFLRYRITMVTIRVTMMMAKMATTPTTMYRSCCTEPLSSPGSSPIPRGVGVGCRFTVGMAPWMDIPRGGGVGGDPGGRSAHLGNSVDCCSVIKHAAAPEYASSGLRNNILLLWSKSPFTWTWHQYEAGPTSSASIVRMDWCKL